MSYDIRFAVKGEPNGRMYVVFEPDKAHPTYNIGEMLRKAMDWDFTNGEWYRVSDVLPNIERGIYQLRFSPKEFEQYEWESISSAISCLSGLLEDISQHLLSWDWNDYDIEHLYMCW